MDSQEIRHPDQTENIDLIHKLLHPLTPGNPVEENWILQPMQIIPTDPPKISLNLLNKDTNNEIRIELSPKDTSRPCYETSQSFNMSFASSGTATLPASEERLLVRIFDVIHENDNGLFRIEIQPDGVPRLLLVEPAPRDGWIRRLLKRLSAGS